MVQTNVHVMLRIMPISSSLRGRSGRHSLLHLLASPALCAAVALVTSCSSESTKSSDALSAFFDAVEAACEQPSCRGDYSPRECKYFFAYDLLAAALQSKNFESCIEPSTAYLSCGATADGCFDASECGEDPLTRSDCAIVQAPNVEPLFEGAVEHCQRQVACYSDRFGGVEADQVQREEAECLADMRARFELYRNHRRACGNAFRGMVECIAGNQLGCSVSAEDEEAACPKETAAWEASCAP